MAVIISGRDGQGAGHGKGKTTRLHDYGEERIAE